MFQRCGYILNTLNRQVGMKRVITLFAVFVVAMNLSSCEPIFEPTYEVKGDPGSLTGVVVNAVTKEPISGAILTYEEVFEAGTFCRGGDCGTIWNMRPGNQTQTDSLGQFSFSNMPKHYTPPIVNSLDSFSFNGNAYPKYGMAQKQDGIDTISLSPSAILFVKLLEPVMTDTSDRVLLYCRNQKKPNPYRLLAYAYSIADSTSYDLDSIPDYAVKACDGGSETMLHYELGITNSGVTMYSGGDSISINIPPYTADTITIQL